MTFRSSLLQDAGVTTIMCQKISTLPLYSNVIQQLRKNFLERTKPWDAMGTKYDFTILLDSYRLGLILGKILPCFCSCVVPKYRTFQALTMANSTRFSTVVHRRHPESPRIPLRTYPILPSTNTNAYTPNFKVHCHNFRLGNLYVPHTMRNLDCTR